MTNMSVGRKQEKVVIIMCVECGPLNKQAVNKAETQLTKDLAAFVAILSGLPPSQIIFQTFVCFPDAFSLELQTIFCSSCFETAIVSQEDLDDFSLLQRKTQVPDRPKLANANGKKKLLILTARCLSNLSLLHIGYRDIQDKEILVVEKHKYNLESIDGKMLQKEFVIASPQQQVIANFTSSTSQRHLVLEGPAGTGKTLVALQVANKLMQPISDTSENASSSEPLLVVTTELKKEDDPIMKYLDTATGSREKKIFKRWADILKEFEIDTYRGYGVQLLHLAEALAKKWGGREIVMLLDEIQNRIIMSKW